MKIINYRHYFYLILFSIMLAFFNMKNEEYLLLSFYIFLLFNEVVMISLFYKYRSLRILRFLYFLFMTIHYSIIFSNEVHTNLLIMIWVIYSVVWLISQLISFIRKRDNDNKKMLLFINTIFLISIQIIYSSFWIYPHFNIVGFKLTMSVLIGGHFIYFLYCDLKKIKL